MKIERSSSRSVNEKRARGRLQRIFCSLLLIGAIMAAVRVGVPAANSQTRAFTLAERVAYQHAIEDVYWRHRIWSKQQPHPKPSLDTVISEAQLERKVQDYLRNSQALENYLHQPITAEQLQNEMDRVAQHTKQPEVLRELFTGLGNDPIVIAECLARPLLTERLVAELSPQDKIRFESTQSKALYSTSLTATLGKRPYTLPNISDPCFDDRWTATSTINTPTARVQHAAVWTGSEMIVWGGSSATGSLNTGGMYNPTTDTWTATSSLNAPTARYFPTAVWTGTEMIIWGGGPAYFNTGGRYNPATNSWTTTSITNAPIGRLFHTAVWTGSEMIVWGGCFGGATCDPLNTGGRYDPSTDRCRATTTSNAPSAREFPTAVWTGTEMIVWGGRPGYFNTGGRYNSASDSWTATSITNAPTGRDEHTAIWTGSKMVIWGGYNGSSGLNTGGRYDPDMDTWTATSTINAPTGRTGQTAVWTGSEMIVWGGGNMLNTGGRYNPETDSWIITSTTNAPDGREGHTAVWTDTKMIVWGGVDAITFLDTGGRYCARSGPTPTPTPRPSPTPRPRSTPRLQSLTTDQKASQ